MEDSLFIQIWRAPLYSELVSIFYVLYDKLEYVVSDIYGKSKFQINFHRLVSRLPELVPKPWTKGEVRSRVFKAYLPPLHLWKQFGKTRHKAMEIYLIYHIYQILRIQGCHTRRRRWTQV